MFFGGVSKNQMHWWESLILIGMYLLYVLIMIKNQKIKAWVYKHFVNGADQRKLLGNESNGYGTEREISMQKCLRVKQPCRPFPRFIGGCSKVIQYTYLATHHEYRRCRDSGL